jgi:GNAT superfamily N-acetyltransferase
MALVHYVFLRGLELEGRHPHDVGAWSLTVRRMEVGEGVPLPTDPDHMIEVREGEPYPPAPKLPPSRLVRFFYYRRIRSSAECERYLRTVVPEVPVSLDLFASWLNPPKGVIPMPKEGERRLDATHLVVLIDSWPEKRQFLFRNTWGEKWGQRGHGVLPYDYVDKYVFESWVPYYAVTPESIKTEHTAGRRDRRWVVRDEWYRRVYGFEVWDEEGKDRCAWAFVLEKDGILEVEEFYVRPEYRRRGYGRVLAEKVAKLARAKQLPLRMWVAFTDSQQENPSNYPALVAVARLLGVQFQPCPVIWAAYFATNERQGADAPVEPARIPQRPKSALEALFALSLAISPSPADHGQPVAPPAAMTQGDDEFPDPGTDAWAGMNRKRAELIRKKNRGGLTPDELREYERLQRLSQAALERVFPAPTKGDEELARIEARLSAPKGANPE